MGDVPDFTPGVYYIEQAYQQRWLDGTLAGGSLLPNQPITLASALQLADVATEAAMYPNSAPDAVAPGPAYATMLAAALTYESLPFSDASAFAPTERGYIAEATLFGIQPGSRSALQLDQPLTQSETEALLSRMQSTLLSRISSPRTAGAVAYIGTTPPEPVPVNCKGACASFEAMAFDGLGYKTSGAITASGGAGVTTTEPSSTTVVQGNTVTVSSQSASAVDVSATTPGMKPITLRAGSVSATAQVPVYAPPLHLALVPASITVAPGATVMVSLVGKDASGWTFPVAGYWSLTRPDLPPALLWGTLSAWGPTVSTTFAAGSVPGQGKILAHVQTLTAQAPLDVESDVSKLSASVVDTTSGSNSVAVVGDQVTLKVDGLTASGQPAMTADLLDLGPFGVGQLQHGSLTVTMAAPNASAFFGSVSDTSNPFAAGAQFSIKVVPELQASPETGVELFAANGTPATPPPLGGNAVAVWVRPIDAKGMTTTVSGTTPQTVDLLTSGTAFSATQNGTTISTVVLSPGSSGVQVWLRASATMPQPVAVAAVAPITVSSTEDGKSVAIGQNFGITYTVLDGYGNPVVHAPVTFAMTTPTGTDTDQNQDPMFALLPTSALTGTDGQASTGLSAPSTTADADFTAQVSASVEGFATSSPITFTW